MRALEGARLVIVAGPGGVGKTTSAAALAVREARAGRRTLVITADPARRLDDALGAQRDAEPRLRSTMIEPSAAFEALLPRMVPDPDARARIERSPVYQRFARSMARTHAYATLEVLHEALRDAQHDVIVLDTPPMRGVLDLLEAPDVLARFAGSAAVDLLAQGPAAGPLSWWLARVLGLVLGAELARGLSEFVTAFAPFRAGFSARAEAVIAQLRAPSTRVALVSSGDPVRLADARALAAALAGRGVAPQLVIGSGALARSLPEWDLDAALAARPGHEEALRAAHRLGQLARVHGARAQQALADLAAELGAELASTHLAPRDPIGPDALMALWPSSEPQREST